MSIVNCLSLLSVLCCLAEQKGRVALARAPIRRGVTAYTYSTGELKNAYADVPVLQAYLRDET